MTNTFISALMGIVAALLTIGVAEVVEVVGSTLLTALTGNCKYLLLISTM